MEEYMIKQKIENAYCEPKAPQELISTVILRSQAVSMGVQALKQLETAPAEQVGALAAQAIVGQLASVSQLPSGSKPEELAQQLQKEPAFKAALCGGNVLHRIQSGELMHQLVQMPADAQPDIPQSQAPTLHL